MTWPLPSVSKPLLKWRRILRGRTSRGCFAWKISMAAWMFFFFFFFNRNKTCILHTEAKSLCSTSKQPLTVYTCYLSANLMIWVTCSTEPDRKSTRLHTWVSLRSSSHPPYLTVTARSKKVRTVQSVRIRRQFACVVQVHLPEDVLQIPGRGPFATVFSAEGGPRSGPWQIHLLHLQERSIFTPVTSKTMKWLGLQ